MADDIDIDEHDVMENPVIRQIFPDLSVLKKEIIDYNNEIQEELSNSEKKYVDIINSPRYRNSISINSLADKHLQKKNFCCNKNLLGSQKNKNIHKHKKGIEKDLISNVKVNLQNVGTELLRSEKFCEKCLILFSTKETLNDHQILCHNNVQDETQLQQAQIINSSDLGKYVEHTDIVKKANASKFPANNGKDDVNVMVKINNSINKRMHSNVRKLCFHCGVVFSSQQSLIDHLYEILSNKNCKIQHIQNQNESDNEKNKEMVQNPMTDEHNTNANQAKEYNKKYNKLYCCPICSYYFDVKKFYIEHLLIKHKLNKKNQIECVEFCSKCIFCNLSYNDVLSYNTHLRKRHRKEINKKQENEIYSSIKDRYSHKLSNNRNIFKKQQKLKLAKEVQVMVLKTFLFKCVECNIHFLTPEAAKNHFNHSEFLQNWECINCEKIFKQKQQNIHEKQHEYSNCFTVVEVSGDIRTIMLYKCPKCAVHFRKENIAHHQSRCESEQPKSSYCRVCDILIDNEIKISHQKEHEARKNNASDFTIIDGDKLDDKQKDEIDKQNSDSEGLMKKYFRYFYFCNVCKCYIPRNCNIDVHRQSKCAHFRKYVCQYCGLVFNTAITIHRRLHKKYRNIRLQDFTFFYLKTKRKMRPRFEFPKCNSCHKHFIHKHEVVNHKCKKDNYLTCSLCNIKFSDSAYRLHKPFHSYDLKYNEKNEIRLLGDVLMSRNDDSNISEIIKDSSLTSSSSKLLDLPENESTFNYVYSCKNCDISLNVYDEVIEHCHLHTNLNRIEIDTVKCTICNLNFIISSYDHHQKLHLTSIKKHFMYFNFDVSYFGSHHDKWLHHVFGILHKDKISKIINKSIYKYENRIKMEIIQNGPFELTLHKCDKCQFFIDSNSLYKHIANCSVNSSVFYCKICNIPFVSNASRSEHENVHINFKTTIKSYRIVSFNRERDKIINNNMKKTKYYVLYECRNCHVIVDKNIYNNHECNFSNCKTCNKCGLLVHDRDYDMHVLKHKQVKSFNKNVMKVVLIGNKIAKKNETIRNNLTYTFSGMVCDYTFYKCVNCDVCLRDQRSTIQHFCLIDAAKSKCPLCDLILDEGKLKGHLKLHDTDPDFTKETIQIKTFGCNKFNETEYGEYCDSNIEKNKIYIKNEIPISNAGVDENMSELNERIPISEVAAKIYKCYCGLHFLDEIEIKEHRKKCSGIVKVNKSKTDCFKCGLMFTPNVLFKHLLKHHEHKNVVFKYEILENIM